MRDYCDAKLTEVVEILVQNLQNTLYCAQPPGKEMKVVKDVGVWVEQNTTAQMKSCQYFRSEESQPQIKKLGNLGDLATLSFDLHRIPPPLHIVIFKQYEHANNASFGSFEKNSNRTILTDSYFYKDHLKTVAITFEVAN